ncbi:MAG TPA: hypothetical protein VMG40_16435 [Bryobacteraceae bacterium]|nr:hypothetical protein [Bryobacteraceae bacterium]
MTALFLLLPVLAQVPSDLPREVMVLAQIRARVRADLEKLPRYTCIETIERSRREGKQPDFRLVDTLRVEVTRIGQEESYSWPGASRFSDSMRDIVDSGTISTGEFSGQAGNVFGNSASQIRYMGEEPLKGRPALKYNYSIAAFASRWKLTYAGQSAMVAESGSFWADPDTLDLVRLVSDAQQIPPELPITSARSQVDYAKMRVGDSGLILPQSALVLTSDHSGENRNEVEFSQCRPYLTESSIRFDDTPPAEVPKPAAMQDSQLPPGISISMELTQAISESAVEGDPVIARVSADARLKNQVVIPKGALLRGRIRRMERYSKPVPHFIIGLEFVAIEAPPRRWTFHGSLERIDPVPGLSWFLSIGHARESRPQLLDPHNGLMEWTWSSYKAETVYSADAPGTGTFFMQGTRFRLPAGLHMTWRTLADVKRR